MDLCTTQYDVCIAGGGIIGLSLALEMQRRGATVLVLEARSAMAEASTAAAGMLAANDPENPLAMEPLAALSIALYPDYLDRIRRMSNLPVGFQTEHTLQAFANRHSAGGRSADEHALNRAGDAGASWDASVEHSSPRVDCDSLIRGIAERHPALDLRLIAERSVAPRELAPALRVAVRAGGIELIEESAVVRTTPVGGLVSVVTHAAEYKTGAFVDCTGAWSKDAADAVRPVKGQMLTVETPACLCVTVRTPSIYLVPRLHGEDAGRTVIGATVEEAGFDKTVEPGAITSLLDQAARLIPSLAGSRVFASWAGLRPATVDGLPLIGMHPTKPHHLLATGHYRNGILLAPATAVVVADLIERKTPTVDLSVFAPERLLAR